MGCSIYAKAIIGVKLPRSPYRETKERGCSHSLHNQSAPFCGECGAKSWIVGSQLLEICDFDNEKIGKFDFLEGGSADDEEFYVGVCPVQTEDCMYASPGTFADISGVDIASLTADLKELLNPVGLWEDDMKVGLWAFGFISV